MAYIQSRSAAQLMREDEQTQAARDALRHGQLAILAGSREYLVSELIEDVWDIRHVRMLAAMLHDESKRAELAEDLAIAIGQSLACRIEDEAREMEFAEMSHG